MLKEILPVDGLERGIPDTACMRYYRFLVLTNCKLATDTVEHIEDDQKALREIHRILAPGGHVMISVPAFPSPFVVRYIILQSPKRYRDHMLSRNTSAIKRSKYVGCLFSFLADIEVEMSPLRVNFCGAVKIPPVAPSSSIRPHANTC